MYKSSNSYRNRDLHFVIYIFSTRFLNLEWGDLLQMTLNPVEFDRIVSMDCLKFGKNMFYLGIKKKGVI